MRVWYILKSVRYNRRVEGWTHITNIYVLYYERLRVTNEITVTNTRDDGKCQNAEPSTHRSDIGIFRHG